MNRANKIAQAYGYAVCFVAVITFILASKNVIDSTFDLSAPVRADRYMSGFSITSFEAYKRDRIERTSGPAAEGAAAPRWTDTELRQMYEEARRDHVENVRFRATRSVVSNLILIVIATGLFFMHWRWLRRESIPE